ncbi:hypothetical protein [Burkholderia cepacia]|uniref:hypothetical protein n=1 Tax=Burkholderia cepacia TaxID=292 RepID=UPI00158BE6D1|nr:hypothetical protein [Burkholderia cepacia]MCA8318567.1 hypothetical protein [Burkholderia cepacia]
MDTKTIASLAGKVALELVVPGYMKAAYSALSSSQDEVKAAEAQGLATLEEEAKKQKVIMEFQAHQARVAQELAIAERIAASYEVTIEEYYEGSGKGHAGLKADGEAVSLGASGEGRRVTKRVIRFNGWTEQPIAANETL